MVTNYEREVATALVEALVEYGLIENLASYGEHNTQNWFQNCNLDAEGFGASGGVSKACIWHDDLVNWVIKVGFTDQGPRRCEDYAAKEYENYLLAVEAGLSYYFPETVFLGVFGGRPFYLQQYAECDEDQVSSEWYERLREQYYYECEEDVWAVIDGMCDCDKAELSFHNEELTEFLEENGINDLHEGNFGYIGDRMVIVDFSGY